MRGRIGRCWASDGKSELELSNTEGCSVQKAGEVWGDFEVSRDDRGTMFLNHIKAWAFPTRLVYVYIKNISIVMRSISSVISTFVQRVSNRRAQREFDEPTKS